MGHVSVGTPIGMSDEVAGERLTVGRFSSPLAASAKSSLAIQKEPRSI